MLEPEFAVPRLAATVILVRERAGTGEVEVFLIRRNRKASFMSSAYVFPGGAADPGEDDLRVTAARELLEEAGVFFSQQSVPEDVRAGWRETLNAHQPAPADMLASLDVSGLHYYARWITPSSSKKRFDATFYIAVLPSGQQPTIDNQEATDAVWVTPAEALARSAELHLHPPQVRTFVDMQTAAERGIDALIESARAMARHRHAIMPRLAPQKTGFALLLPWDPDYLRTGTGDALTMPADHPLAVGPSRFVHEDKSWNNVDAPSSPDAE